MSVYASLKPQLEALQKLYTTNEEVVRTLQRVLSKDILPGLIDELGISHTQKEALESWLMDTREFLKCHLCHQS